MQQFGYDVNNPQQFDGTGTIILLTDGRENSGRYKLPEATDKIANTSVVVHVISFGQLADTRLRNLAQRTGGLLYFAATDKNDVDLIDALAAMIRSGAKVVDKSIDVSIQILNLI